MRDVGLKLLKGLVVVAGAGYMLVSCVGDVLVDASAAKACKSRAEQSNTEAAWAAMAEEKGIDGDLAAMMNTPASREEGKGYDWATCMTDRGWRCVPGNPPGPCSSEDSSADNPFG